MASSVTEEDITKLRAAGYLAANIAHRLPAEGQITPTPKSRERVVLLSHFIRGLGLLLAWVAAKVVWTAMRFDF